MANFPASATGSVSVTGTAVGTSHALGYTITKVGLTQAGNYPAGCLYFVVQFANGIVNDFVFPDILTNPAITFAQIPDIVLQTMTNLAAKQAQGLYAASGVDPHITVNPNVGGVPAAAMAMNGTSGTLRW